MAFLFIILGTLMWSIDTLIRYPLLGQVSASTIVLLEHSFLVIYFIPFLFMTKFNLKRLSKNHLLAFAVIGFVGSAASTLAFTHAFTLINPTIVILLQKLQVFVAITLSSFILKEKFKKNFYIYGFIAFIGAFLISFPDLQNLLATDVSHQSWFGYTLTLFAVVGWAASTVYGKKLALDNYSESEIMAGRFIFGFVFIVFYSFYLNPWQAFNLNPDIYFKILIMIVLSGLLGMYFYYRGLKNLSAHATAIAELFFPLSAILINWIFLGQSLKPLQLLGAAVLLTATALIKKYS